MNRSGHPGAGFARCSALALSRGAGERRPGPGALVFGREAGGSPAAMVRRTSALAAPALPGTGLGLKGAAVTGDPGA